MPQLAWGIAPKLFPERGSMGPTLKSITLCGFRSIVQLHQFPLDNINILIGANGAGKSNFIEFFRMMRAIVDRALPRYVRNRGGGSGFFHLGPKHTPRIQADLDFGDLGYRFEIGLTASDGLQLIDERVRDSPLAPGTNPWVELPLGLLDSILPKHRFPTEDSGKATEIAPRVFEALSQWIVYHFHDTSRLAPMRMPHEARDSEWLRHDASNIASVLCQLREKDPDSYGLIRDTVRLGAPFFDDFVLRPEDCGGVERIRLEWKQTGSDYPFQPMDLSDGTIRFVCLTVALLQPHPPGTLVIDEPELGLHPCGLALVANLVRSVSKKTQILISTQSPVFLDHFDPEHVVVATRRKGESCFERLSGDAWKEWLDDYTLGELWQKNICGGAPNHE
jgi:predicted ATPase